MMPKHKVTFQPGGVTVEVDPAEFPYGRHGLPGSLLDIALTHGVHIEHACGGVGVCGTCHVVVAEGAKMKDDAEMTLVEEGDERFGMPRLGGIGYRVKEGIEQYVGLESRVVVLGHLQRGGSPNAFDRVLASRMGCAAVDLIAQGKFGHMACIEGDKITSVPIEKAISGSKLVNPDGEIVKVARALGISFGDE